MRASHLIIPVLALSLSGALAQDNEEEAPNIEEEILVIEEEAPAFELDTAEAKSGYALGMQTGEQMKQQGVEMDVDAYAQGIKDVLAGEGTLLTRDESMQVLVDYQRQMEKKAAAKRERDMAENKKEGAEFLKENAKREGVVTTASGLQYEVLEEGDGGTKPTLADSVTVHYVGKLLNGTEFDSSVARGEPATFKLRTVIPGWTEVLQLMSPGDKYRAVIPAHLAYGDRGAPPNIPPSAVLDFEVQLISVEVGGASKVNIKPPGL